MTYDVVIPTIGRPSLLLLLERLVLAFAIGSGTGAAPEQIVVVDDRPDDARYRPLDASVVPEAIRASTSFVRSFGGGPARARNAGWRAGRAEWVAFLDDDVSVPYSWAEDLARDIAACGDGEAASYARVVVPLPAHRAPTDWERNVAGLARAEHITADAAFRRSALERVGGFDERFPRAYREDADLALRLEGAGYALAEGRRTIVHPVRAAGRWISIAQQRGNADDALMLALHGDVWQERVRGEISAYAAHERVVASALDAVQSAVRGDGRAARRFALRAAAGIALFAAQRIVPGPLVASEIVTMALTSVAIPFAAVAHRSLGADRARRLLARARAVLFDRDGTLVRDAPIGGDRERVEPYPEAALALRRLREARVAIGVVTNQPGLGRGAFTAESHAAVCERIESLLGPVDTWAVCDHLEDAGCACRKPAPELVVRAARTLGVRPDECVVIGDIGSDMAAARAAGARAILVPTPVTRDEEIRDAPHVATSLGRAVDLVLSGAV